MADWTGKMEVPVPPSTKGCNKYLSYLPVYISHIDHLLSDQKYMYSYNISTFNFFIIMQEIILIQRLCPDDLFICLQYISHILYIYTYVKSFFTILEPNIQAPPPPPTPPNPTLYFIGISSILESFCTDENFCTFLNTT